MNKFKVGDIVVCRERHPEEPLWAGSSVTNYEGMDQFVGTNMVVISEASGAGNVVCNNGYRWKPEWLELVEDNKNLKENDMTTQKFYRLKKDTPAIVAGAILRNTCDTYEPISDVWEVFPDRPKSAWGEWIVEHATDWYERVYEVQVNGQTKYLLQADARAAVEANLSDTTPAS